jgi:hypothetical protein
MENLVTCLWNLNLKLIGLLKAFNSNLDDASQLRKLQINELEE